MSTRSSVVDAARALAQAKKDLPEREAKFLRSVLSQNFITPGQAKALHKLVGGHRAALKELGFAYAKLDVPTTIVRFDTGEPRREAPPAPVAQERKREPRPAVEPWPVPDATTMLAAFPPEFAPREQQAVALEKIQAAFASGKRVAVLEMPTGGGKSFVCKTVANAVKAHGGTHFLTIQKNLQDQYTRDFPAPEIETLKGRSNYPCTHPAAEEGQDCGDGVCHRTRKRGILIDCIDSAEMGPLEPGISPLQAAVALALPASCHRCPYWAQLQRCHDNPIALFNFSSFLFQQRIGRFGKRRLMIVDEAHNVEAQLMSFVSLELTEWKLSIIDVRIDRDIRTRDEFMDWMRAQEVEVKIARKLKAVEAASDSLPADLSKAEAEALQELAGKIEMFLRYFDKTEWILEVVEYEDRRGDPAKKVVARPLYARDFAQDLLFRHADRVLFMSATILDAGVWAENLGLDADEVEVIRTPCDFPVENRPVYMEYAGDMGYKHFSPKQNPTNPTRPRFVAKVYEILRRHEGQRGIIHCHSFELSRVLEEEVASPRFLFQDNFADKTEMLAEHARRDDSVIVAPAMHEGFDLRDDLARFQVIAKVPYPSLADKVIKERMGRDSRWYTWLTALKIVQSYGRAVRSRQDWATTYILDSGFAAFAKRAASILPGWFKEALRSGAPVEVMR